VKGAAEILIVVLGVACVGACGNDDALKGINAACTRSSDCQGGLSCINGLCEPPDAGEPADSGSDTSHPGSDAASAG
jgi:hypothetical protein